MAASILLSECLEEVFVNLLCDDLSVAYIYTKDLYHCTLVSRHWCRISTPFLYSYPFHYLVYSDSHISTFFKLIRTLLSCVPKSEIEKIISSNSSHLPRLFTRSHKKSCSSDNFSTFNYITYIHGIIFNETLFDPYKLFSYRKFWLPSYVSKNNTTQHRFSKISIPIISHLLKFLCKNCNNLLKLEFPFTVQDNELFNDIIESLTFKDRNGKSKLNNLKELFYISRYDLIAQKDLYSLLSNSIYNLSLLCNEGVKTVEKANSLSQFISLQKNLQHIILMERFMRLGINYNIVFNSLSTQSESLQVLEFKDLIFDDIDEKALDSLCSLKNIRELKLFDCKGVENLLTWTKNLSNLEVFEFVTYCFSSNLEEFLIQLIQTSSSTLTRLIINYESSSNRNRHLLKQIPPSLIHLELSKIFPSELISIFQSCSQLTCISITLSGCELWEEDFKIMGKFIPKKLQKIQIKEVNRFLFSSESLRCFLRDCVYSEGTFNCLEVNGKLPLGPNYFDVAKEFGIQLIKKRA